MSTQLACPDCSRFFPTKIGLSQHRRYAHPTQNNADKLSRVKYSSARWSQQESQLLLRLANNLYPSCDTQTTLFARLEQYFPGRSTFSIKNRLRVLNWQAQQDNSSSDGPDQTIGQIAAYSSEDGDYSVWFKQTVGCAVSLLESHADSSLASVDLLAFARGSCGLPLDAKQYWKRVLPAPKQDLITPLGPTDIVTYLGTPFTFKGKGVFNHRRRLLKLFNESTETRSNGRTTTSDNLFVAGYVYRWIPRSATSMPCRVLRNVVNDSAFEKIVRDLSLTIRVHGSCVNTKKELVAAWGDSLHNSVDGRGLRELVASSLSNRWLVFQKGCFLGYLSAVSSSDAPCSGQELEALDMVPVARRSYVVETVANQRVWCIFCSPAGSRMTPDVLGLQGNLLNASVAWDTPSAELRAPTSRSFIKPDLIAVWERQATVIDVSIVSDGRGMTVWN
ncbi:endonuclease-reverse transcriptase [Clonorchis sinensis]|uniref:Endonuclease-reverse transcriptase n=1 Tax=Clonorchis sinensis TaxID=79923 RepID=G7YNA7_CLOSI|nr:endonuclease-reverse transcriptase [Clonorchis sinensis]